MNTVLTDSVFSKAVIKEDEKRATNVARFSPEVRTEALVKGIKRSDATPGEVTVAVVGVRGGVGTSTVALCLAAQTANSARGSNYSAKRIVVVDLNPINGDIAALAGQSYPIKDDGIVYSNRAYHYLKEHLIESALGITVLPAPDASANSWSIDAGFYREVIRILETQYDAVILDCSSDTRNPLLGVGLSLADEVIVVTTASVTRINDLKLLLTEMFADETEHGLNLSRHKIGVVVNQAINNVGVSQRDVLEASLGVPLVGQIPSERDVVSIASNHRRLGDILKHPRLGRAYFALADMCFPRWSFGEWGGFRSSNG